MNRWTSIVNGIIVSYNFSIMPNPWLGLIYVKKTRKKAILEQRWRNLKAIKLTIERDHALHRILLAHLSEWNLFLEVLANKLKFFFSHGQKQVERFTPFVIYDDSRIIEKIGNKREKNLEYAFNDFSNWMTKGGK